MRTFEERMSHKFRQAEASIEENRVRDRSFMMYFTLKVDEDDLDSDEQVDEPDILSFVQ